ncbi:MAG: 23S rRNA (pseudouridine(1915)-N(3))-methyltransferase RlmH [Xanthomonadales bacterium]|nr:23S rRNA (pseudouridine(1915)-N(3))-methyltransferase RlmH [Xanthomonadales bacterium]NNL95463.1 23S rRNA (pseudouridine(1915)-N(3))-methyltransferase RlmH [Xanthomonadales bacterium]
MHFKVAAIGQRMPSWVSDAWREYSKRFPRNPSIELIELATARRGRNADISRLVESEGDKLLAAIPDHAVAVALDERGEAWSTKTLAEHVRGWMAGGQDVYFMIGGPDGLSSACIRRADKRWSIGPLTLPHPLVRVILVEQLYRALMVVGNHPYHRA